MTPPLNMQQHSNYTQNSKEKHTIDILEDNGSIFISKKYDRPLGA